MEGGIWLGGTRLQFYISFNHEIEGSKREGRVHHIACDVRYTLAPR